MQHTCRCHGDGLAKAVDCFPAVLGNCYHMRSMRFEQALTSSLINCPQAQFYGLLVDYLTSAAGNDALNDVVLASNGTIVTSQLGFSHTASYNQVRRR